jgi:hypothetical protein
LGDHADDFVFHSVSKSEMMITAAPHGAPAATMGGEEEKVAKAEQGGEMNNSVPNSVLSHTEFTNMMASRLLPDYV